MSFQIFFFLISFLKITLEEDLCSEKEEKNCLFPLEGNKKVSFNVPIFQGRCCLNSLKQCEYVSETSLGKIKNNNYKCGTRMESCLSHIMKNALNKEECTTFSIEMPYRCCYIKYKSEGRCFPIDTSRHKNIYSTKYHIKAELGYFDGGDIHIDCIGDFLKVRFLTFFFVLALLVL